MSPSQQDLPHDAGPGFGSRLIDTIVKMSPSQQQKRGDHELDEADALIHESVSVIPQGDLAIIEYKIIQ
jgi:hypothetical protein